MNVNQRPHSTRNFMAKKNKIRPGNIGLVAGRCVPARTGHRQCKPNISFSTTDGTPKIAALFRARYLNTSYNTSKTPQSSISNTTDSDDSHMVIAICEGRGEAREEVGMAALDLRRPELGIYQVSDTQGYTQTIAGINVLNPIEILVPLTLSESRLVHILKQKFCTVTINSVPRRLYDANMGLQLVHHLCAQIYANSLLDVQHKYYALAATSALVNHVESYKRVAIATKSLKIIYLRMEHITAIDCDTAYRLELVASTRGSNKHASLFGILNHTLTNGGRRFLRANILQPLCKRELIDERLQSVEELANSPDLLNSLQHTLSKFINVDSILTLCMKTPDFENSRTAEVQINYIIRLKSILGAIEPLREAITLVQAPALVKIKENLESPSYEKMNKTILGVIQKDAFPSKGNVGDMQRCFSVRYGINQLLDLTRKSYSELIDTARGLIAELSEQLHLPLQLNCNTNKGFHIVMKLAPHQRKMKVKDFPPKFINVTRHPTSFSMTTAKLVQLSKRLKNTQQEIELLSYREIFNVLNEIRGDISCLYTLCENIAELDLIQSLAEVAKIPNYVKPTFCDDYLDIQEARHPMLEFLMEHEPVSNNIFMTKHQNFHVITGPNMSGKSIYIKQIVLLHIMAQIGSFIPAKSACFRITDRIFARINFDDCIECDASTFQLDIREMKVIIETLTPTSLVIIDELCRGTVHDEGTAIAWALSEQFLDKTAFVFLTTHFLTLTKLEDMYLNVTNWHMESRERKVGEDIRLSYTYRLLYGVTNLEKYGLAAARASAIPKSVVARASEIVDQLTPSVKAIQNLDKPNIIDRLKYNLVAKIKFLESTNQLTDVLFGKILNDFNENLQKILQENNLDDDIPRDLINVKDQIERLQNNEMAKMDDTSDNMELLEIDNCNVIQQVGDYSLNIAKSSQAKHSKEIFQATMSQFLEGNADDDDIISQEASLALDYFNINSSSANSKNISKSLNCLDLVCANYSISTTSDTSDLNNINSEIVDEDFIDHLNQNTPFENISTSDTSEMYVLDLSKKRFLLTKETDHINTNSSSSIFIDPAFKNSVFQKYETSSSSTSEYLCDPSGQDNNLERPSIQHFIPSHHALQPNSKNSTSSTAGYLDDHYSSDNILGRLPNQNLTPSNANLQQIQDNLNLSSDFKSFRNINPNYRGPIFSDGTDNQSVFAQETPMFNKETSQTSKFDNNFFNDEITIEPHKLTFKDLKTRKRSKKSNSSGTDSDISKKLASSFRIINTFVEQTSTASNIHFGTNLTSTSTCPGSEFSNLNKVEFKPQSPRTSSSGISHLFSDGNCEGYEQFINNIEQYKPKIDDRMFKCVFRSDVNMTKQFF